MAKSKHSPGVRVEAFCAYRTKKCTDPCKTSNKYQENCNPPPTGWEEEFFWQGRKKATEKTFEAHHLLCIASVTEFIGKKREIQDIVKQTEWCINSKTNMYAMPLWGHTIKYYCDLALGGKLKDRNEGPKFENVPQHDYDHNSKKGYKKNHVDKALKKIANQIEEKAKENHEAAVKQLGEVLDRLSNSFRSMLQAYGARSEGTHKAWSTGIKHPEPESGWYLPFSMGSNANAEKRTFPAPDFSGKTAKKIKRLVEAFGKWGAT
jgi:hypothetical protein